MSTNKLPSVINFTKNDAESNYATRGFADYHSTIWGHHFLIHVYEPIDPVLGRQYRELKEEMRKMVMEAKDATSQNMQLINFIQRLGVGYHFKSELEDAIENFSRKDIRDDDLHVTALWFRLLRQQGIHASCEVFEKFKDAKGKFDDSLADDVLGMLSLYEAAHLAVHGEDILDEAIDFTTKNLHLISTRVAPDIALEIIHALNRPIRKCLPRLDTRHYITVYEKEKSHNKTLLLFAKIDFTIVQKLHQKELEGITTWWKSLDVSTRLPYARDRIVELYFWIMGVYSEPQYSVARKILTKTIAILSLCDDTYDNYASPQELDLFTEAIQRWDISAINKLPDNMKIIYGALLDLYEEIEEDLTKLESLYALPFAKKAIKRALGHYYIESQWRTKGYMPTMEEYMRISCISSCFPALSLSSFLGMGKVATEEAYEWVSNDPKMVRASTVVCRLMDDIVSHEFEQEREHIPSAVECYKRQHGMAEEEIVKVFRKEIVDAWKDMNEELLMPTAVPVELLERVLNLARAMDVIYKEVDGYTNSHVIKDQVVSLLTDSVL